MNRRLRVLHVGKFYPPYRGGMESHLQTLCDELSRLVDLTVLVSNTTRETVIDETEPFRLVRLRRVAQFAAASICPDLLGEIRAADVDIIHLHLPNPTAVLALLLSGHKAKVVVTYHSDVVRQRYLALGFHPFLTRLLNRSAAIVAASPNYIDSSSVLSAYRRQCTVIPFGIRLDELDNVDARQVQDIRKRFGRRIIVSVGRMVYYKGFEYLIEAMTHVDGHLLLIGDGPLRGSLQDLIARRGLADRVSIVSGVDDLAPYYHASELFVLPSIARSEAFGIVQLEAMACSKPVVNTQLDSGVPFVSPDGVTGRTVQPCDSQALAAAINELLDNDALRHEFGRAARRRVEQEFSVPVMVARTMQLYDDVMSGRPGRAAGQDRAASALVAHP